MGPFVSGGLPDGQTSYEYDQYGNVTQVSDANDHATITQWDGTYHSYPLAVTNALTQTTAYEYDYRLGRVVAQTDPNGARTTYEYDPFGRRTKLSLPDGEGEAELAATYSYTSSMPFHQTASERVVGGKIATLVEGFQIANAHWVSGGNAAVNVWQEQEITARTIGGGTWGDYIARAVPSLRSGGEARFEFKITGADPCAAYFLSADGGGATRRWGIKACWGVVQVEYADAAGWHYPSVLVNPLALDTWYAATLRVDDVQGFQVEVHPRGNAGASASYTQAMPAGFAWQFQQGSYAGTAYTAHYSEGAGQRGPCRDLRGELRERERELVVRPQQRGDELGWAAGGAIDGQRLGLERELQSDGVLGSEWW